MDKNMHECPGCILLQKLSSKERKGGGGSCFQYRNKVIKITMVVA